MLLAHLSAGISHTAYRYYFYANTLPEEGPIYNITIIYPSSTLACYKVHQNSD